MRPVALDFAAIADGVIRNNMGLGGIQVRVRGRLDGGQAVLDGTGQRVPLVGAPAAADGAWLWFEARELGLGAAKAATWLRSSAGPVLSAPSADVPSAGAPPVR